MFPNLCYLQLDQWPLTVAEASLLFGAQLRTIKLARISMSSSPKYYRHKHWGRLTKNLQQQLCIQLLRRRANSLSTFQTHISIGVLYEYPHKVWTMSGKRPPVERRFIHLVGSTNIHIEYLGYLARIGDLSCLQDSTANPYITDICEVELCITAHDTQYHSILKKESPLLLNSSPSGLFCSEHSSWGITITSGSIRMTRICIIHK